MDQKSNTVANQSATFSLPTMEPLETLIESPRLIQDRTQVLQELRPILIPQITNLSLGNRDLIPFSRCYPPELAGLIEQNEFLDFIDGLNKVYAANSFFEGFSYIGESMFGAGVLQIFAGMAVIVGNMGSGSISAIRTRKYMKAAKKNLFTPRGLTVRITSTRDVMAVAGLRSGQLLRAPGQASGSEHGAKKETTQEDPRARWLNAFGSRIAQLKFDIPPIELQIGRMRSAALTGAQEQDDAERLGMREAESRAEDQAHNSNLKVASLDTQLAEVEQQLGAGVQDKALIKQRDNLVKQRKAASKKSLSPNAVREKIFKKDELAVQSVLWLVIVPEGSTGATSTSAFTANRAAHQTPAARAAPQQVLARDMDKGKVREAGGEAQHSSSAV